MIARLLLMLAGAFCLAVGLVTLIGLPPLARGGAILAISLPLAFVLFVALAIFTLAHGG